MYGKMVENNHGRSGGERKKTLQVCRIQAVNLQCENGAVLQGRRRGSQKSAFSRQDKTSGHNRKKIGGGEDGFGRAGKKNQNGNETGIQQILRKAEFPQASLVNKEKESGEDGGQKDDQQEQDQQIVGQDNDIELAVAKDGIDGQQKGVENHPQQQHPEQLVAEHLVDADRFPGPTEKRGKIHSFSSGRIF